MPRGCCAPAPRGFEAIFISDCIFVVATKKVYLRLISQDATKSAAARETRPPPGPSKSWRISSATARFNSKIFRRGPEVQRGELSFCPQRYRSPVQSIQEDADL